jgi:hypothetical protein
MTDTPDFLLRPQAITAASDAGGVAAVRKFKSGDQIVQRYKARA